MTTLNSQRFRHLTYVEAGSSGDPPLFLLHGGTMTALWNWGEALPAFAQHFWVIAPDAPGHGKSANPRTTLRYEDMAADVLALASSLGLRQAAFYGFSDGAQIALELAMREPAVPTALVLSAAMHKLTSTYRASMLESVGPEGFAEPAWSSAHPALATKCRAHHPAWSSLAPQVWELWMRPLELPADRLARVNAPTLLLTGDRDPFVPLEPTVELLGLLPRAELAVIPGAGHDYDQRFTRIALEYLCLHAHERAA